MILRSNILLLVLAAALLFVPGRAHATTTSCVNSGPPAPSDLSAWSSKLATRSKTRFWWKTANDKQLKPVANTLSSQLDNVIYPKLTRLMARTPLPDDGMPCAHGSDGNLDIYLVDALPDPKAEGQTMVYTCNSTPNASYIMLAQKTKQTLAHEFFHVLQSTFADQNGCNRPGWLEEGTAEWAVEYVYPRALKDSPNSSWLQAYLPALNDPAKSYDAWPFWYSVAKHAGADAIAATFAELEHADPLPATDDAIGGFADRWPEFARDAYNKLPVRSFRQWMGTTWQVNDPTHPLGLNGKDTEDWSLPGSRSIKPLARTYDLIAFETPVRAISILGQPTAPGYHLHALLHMANGSWKEKDVTGGATFCRDKPAENVAEMVLVGSNSSTSEPVSSDAVVRLRSSCGQGGFRVVGASFSTHTTGGMTSDTQPCGTVSGSEDASGHLVGPLDSSDFAMRKLPDGTLRANVAFDIDATGSSTLDGCTEPWTRKLACHKTISTTRATGKEPFGVVIEIDPAKPTVARLQWNIRLAMLGSYEEDDSNCNVAEMYNALDLPQMTTEVPVDQVKHGEHTFRNAGTTSWTKDRYSGKPASMGFGWTYEITLQPLDGTGKPIP